MRMCDLVDLFTEEIEKKEMTEDNQLIAIGSEHLKLNHKLDKSGAPKSDMFVIVPDMQIKSSFKE